MINFDNAATTYPKPLSVRQAAAQAVVRYGGNAGRGGHELTRQATEMVYAVRESAADFFDAEPEHTVFCMNCTHALNTAIQGVLKDGDHVVISSIEHNAVYRPVAALVKAGKITCTMARVAADTSETLENFRRAIREHTKAVICTIAGNVTGQRLPVQAIGRLCQERGICFIADGAQACGVVPVSLKADGISILCTAGHKGLYGTTGTGLLLTDGKFPIKPLLYGGTGSASASPYQPDFMPDRLESGTQNIVGIAALGAGLAFVRKKTAAAIFAHEQRLCQRFLQGLAAMPEMTAYRNAAADYVPIVSFNAKGIPPETLAAALDKEGFCLRAGLHCAVLAHQTLGTPQGTVRFAPSVFNTEQEVVRLLQQMKKCVYNLKNE